jgi:adenylosuccinate synthase
MVVIWGNLLYASREMSVDAVLGLQRGDEGKGRFVDMLAENYDIVARFNGGNNAGHTVVLPNGEDLKLHLIPSGIARPGIMNIVGNGTLIDPIKLADEFDYLGTKGIEVNENNLKISSGAHLILPHHVSIDEIRELGDKKQGSTKTGIAPASASKAMRDGIRVEDINNNIDKVEKIVLDGLLAQRELREKADLEVVDEQELTAKFLEKALRMGSLSTDTVLFLNQRLGSGARVLAEGAQAFLLDIDHGMYPATTSSSTTIGGVLTGLGIRPSYVDRIYGVAKAVYSHVGGGPFVTEIHDESDLSKLHGDVTTIDAERGTTTDRTRRLGYLDVPQIRRANMVNGTHEMFLTKLDWIPRYGEEIVLCTGYTRKEKLLDLSPDSARKLEQSDPQYERLPNWSEDIQNVRNYDDLPENAKNFVTKLQELLEVPITKIGVGPQRDQVINR